MEWLRMRAAWLALVTVFAYATIPSGVIASTWNPTLLANTEAFHIIDDRDGVSNVELRFGDSLGEKLLYDRSNARFKFTRSLFIAGTLTTTGSAIINVGANVTATPETTLEVIGSMSGRSLQVTGTGAQPLIATSITRGTILMGTGGIRNGTGAMNPHLYVTGRVAFSGSGATGLNSPRTVVVQESYAYVINSGDNTLAIFDVSNPSTLVNIASTSDGLDTPLAAAVQGRYAYVTSAGNNALVVFDVSNPAAPVRVGSTTSGISNPRFVYVQGRYAYVTSLSNNSLLVFDVSNPSVPVLIGTTTTGLNQPEDIFVHGRYAFVLSTNNNTLIVFDVGNPSVPVQVGSTTSGLDNPRSIYVQGQYAYVTSAFNNSLVIYDISNPTTLTQVGSFTSGVDAPKTVFVQGRFAYIVNGGSTNSLQLVDIANPSLPLLVATSTRGMSGPFGVYVRGRYAYVTSSLNSRLLTFDLGGAYVQQFEAGGLEAGTLNTRGDAQVGNNLDVRGGLAVGRGIGVGAPSAITSTTSGAYALRVTSVTSRTGALAISAHGGTRAPHIFFGSGSLWDTNLFRSASATLRTSGSFTAGATVSGANLTFMGGASYILGNLMIGSSGTASEKLEVAGTMSGRALTISGTGGHPLIGTSLQRGTIIMGTGGIRTGTGAMSPQLYVAGRVPGTRIGSGSVTASPENIYVQGRYAYIVTSGGNKLHVFDVSNPTWPQSVGSADTSSGPRPVYVQGKYAYVGSDGANVLEVFDVSKPLAPILIGSVTTGDDSMDIYVQGRYAYVTNLGSALEVFDVANPYAPILVGSGSTGPLPTGLTVQGRYAYVVNSGLDTLQIFDLSNPSKPYRVGSIAAGGNPDGVAVHGRYAYVTNFADNNLYVFDVSNPASPVNIATVTTASSPQSVQVQGRYLFVLNVNSHVMQVFDISDPRAITLVGAVTTGNAPNSLAVQGRYAYVLSGNSKSFNIFDLGGAYVQQLEAGGGEFTGLAVRNNLAVQNTADIRGGLTVGEGLQATGPSSITSTSSGAYALKITSVTSRTGALAINAHGGTRAPHISFGSGVLFDTNLFRSAANTLRTDGIFQSNSLIVPGTTAFGGITYTWPGAAAASSGKVLKVNPATGQLSWSDDTGGSGLSVSDGDARYVNESGDGMTGGLLIKSGNPKVSSPDSGLLFEVVGTSSGQIFHGQNILRSSGTVVTESGGIFDAGTFYIAANTNRVGVNMTLPETTLDVGGTISGAMLTIMNNSTSYIMGNLALGMTTAETKLDVVGTVSGTTLTFMGGNSYILGNLMIGSSAAASEKLEVAGTMSGRSLFVSGTGAAKAPLIFADVNDGRVGIGTDTPQERLTVSGGNLLIGKKPNSVAAGFTLVNSAAGTFGGESNVDGVWSSVVWNGKIYIGTMEANGAAVYRWDGNSTFTKVSHSTAGRIVAGDATDIDRINLTVFNGKLWAGTRTAANTAAVYSYDGTTWTLHNSARGTFGAETNRDGVWDLQVWNGQLYVTTEELNASGLYRYDGGTNWARVNGTVGSCTGETADIEGGPLIVYGGSLYWGAVTGGGVNTARICVFTGTGGIMRKVNTTAGTLTTGAPTGLDDIHAMGVWNGQLYTGASETNLSGIYSYRGTFTSQSVNTNYFLKTTTTSGRVDAINDATDVDQISALYPYNGRFYALTQTNNLASLYEYKGPGTSSGWLLINGTRGTFGAQANVDTGATLVQLNGSLYVGTAEANAGGFYVWSKSNSNSYDLMFDSGTGTNVASLNFVGNFQSNSNLNRAGTFQLTHPLNSTSGAFDYAEDYPTFDDDIRPGDLVSIDPHNPEYVKRALEGDGYVGIVSERPGFRLSAGESPPDGGSYIPIALVGRVPITVSLEAGTIRPGDYLTGSKQRGVAKRATKAGLVIGQAMSGFGGPGLGKVTGYIKNVYYPGGP